MPQSADHELRSRARRGVLCFLAALLIAPAVARAESAVVLVPQGAMEGDGLARARSAAIEVLAEHGVRLLRAPDGPVCEAPECAASIAEESGASFVVLIRVEDGDVGSRVRATVVRPDDDPYEALAPVGETGVGPAAAAAVERALEQAGDRRLGFLMVRTDPPRAAVEIDGEPAGESPLRRMVAPGLHRVRVVSAEGEAREQTVTVRPVEETAVEVDFAEAPEADAATAAGPTRTEPSPLNWLIAGGLAIGGVAALVSPLQTLATEGECVDEIENVGCVERVQFGAVSGVLLGIGAAALISAVVVEVVAPIRVNVAVGADEAMLSVQGRF